MNQRHLNYVESFLSHCQQKNKSFDTVKNYAQDLKKFIQWFEYRYEQKLERVNGKVIDDYLDFLSSGGSAKKRPRPWWKLTFSLRPINKQTPALLLGRPALSIASKRRHLVSIRLFFEFLKEEFEDSSSKFQVNPVKRKRHQIKLKDTDIKHTQMIYPEQWEVLIEKTWRVEDRLLLSLMYYGGLRISEVAKLFSHALDYENKILTVARKGGKLHRFRPIECPHLAQMWKAVLNRKTEEFKFLFAKRANQIPSARALYARVKKLLLHAGLPDELSPHSFRKACGTMLYQRTKDLLYVKDYLNHSDARVTQTYIDTLYLTQHGQMPSFQVQ